MKLYCVSTTAINDRHASQWLQVNCRNSSETISGLQFRLNHGLLYVWGEMLDAYYKFHPKPKSITQLKNGTACHRNRSTRLLKASHYDWRDAQKLTVNNPSTQSDCQTSDITVKILSFKTKTLCRFSDAVLRCFGANVFSTRKSLIGHAKIAITSSHLNIIKRHLTLNCR